MALWTPADLAVGPLGWWDASDAATVTLNGSTVSQINDKSGGGHHLVQAVATEQPTYSTLNGLGALFSASLDEMGGGSLANLSASPFSVAFAGSIASNLSNGGGAMWGLGATSLYSNQANFGLTVNGTSNTIANGADVTPFVDAPAVFVSTYDSTVESLSANGTNTIFPANGSFSLTNSGGFAVFNRWPFGGNAATASNSYIGEILVLGYVLSLSDRQKLEGYLAWKWRTEHRLPSDHPYKLGAPTTSGSRTWAPADLPSLVAWHDPSDVTSVTLNGSTVSQLNDKSGNNYHVSQATASAQPTYLAAGINGLNVVQAADGKQLFNRSIPSVNGALFGGVVRVVDSNGGGWLDVSGAGPAAFLGYGVGKGGANFDSNGYRAITIAHGIAWDVGPATPLLVQGQDYVFSGGPGTASGAGLHLNGTFHDTFSGGNLPATGITYGASYFGARQTADYIGEWVVADAITVDDRQKLEGYLAHKWGTTASLPADHPYKSAPPEIPGGGGPVMNIRLGTQTPTAIYLGGDRITRIYLGPAIVYDLPPDFFAPYPAPSGFVWQFVTVDGERVTSNGEPVVELVEV